MAANHDDQIMAEPEDDLEEIPDDDEIDPKEAVQALYEKYKLQKSRWSNYGHLGSFVFFFAMYLLMLYLQRNAQATYVVHSTIKDMVVPGDSTMTSSSDVVDWLKDTLDNIWRDPVCGDGICEEPFEFPSYGRFGCRADCGRLRESYSNLTTIAIDLKWNFKHPVGSVPSTELMKQASWNLCPRDGAPHGRDCYWTSDEKFSKLSGNVHMLLDDVPDGEWILIIRRDIFNKVSGAVRNYDIIREDATATMIEIAANAAEAGRALEAFQLNLAATISLKNTEEVIADYLTYSWDTFNASIFEKNTSGTFDDSNGLYSENLYLDWYTANYPFQDHGADGNSTVKQYTLESLLPGDYQIGTSDHLEWYKVLNECSNIPEVYDQDSILVPRPDAPICTWYSNMTAKAFERRLNLVRTALATRIFLSEQEVKYTQGNLSEALDLTQPELLTEIRKQTGNDPENFPTSTALQALSLFYLEPVKRGEVPPQFKAPLSKTRLNQLEWDTKEDQDRSLEEVRSRIDDRLGELEDVSQMMEDLKEVQAMRAYIASKTISDITYNYITWFGGENAYMSTNLTLRAPHYLGECRKNVSVTMTAEKADDTNTYYWDVVPDIRNPSIERYVDIQGCQALCYCEDTECQSAKPLIDLNGDSKTATYCECSACRDRLVNPTDEDEFKEIENVYNLGDSLDVVNARRNLITHRRRLLADHPVHVAAQKELLHLKHAARRRLQQTPSDSPEADLLVQLISDMGQVSSDQTKVGEKVDLLEKAVVAAQEQQEARSADKTLDGMIAAARTDISSGHLRFDEILGEIIEKQNEAAAAAEAALASLAQIQELNAQYIKSLNAVEEKLQEQLGSIMVAARDRIISLSDALTLWKKTRLTRLRGEKQAILSNLETSNFTAIAYPFTVKRYPSYDEPAARQRYIGLNNRVIAGMLLHTTRTTDTDCSDSRFNGIENTCAGGLSINQYGVDPIFKIGADMYNPDLDNDLSMTAYYNCSQLKFKYTNSTTDEVIEVDVTYNVPDPFNPGATTNAEPYCAELFNTREMPWGFHHFPMDYFEDGFPVWFDINLDEQGAQRYFKYVEEGLFLDGKTQSVSAQIVTYNSAMKVFASCLVKFSYTDGGSIEVSHVLDTVEVELYSEPVDFFRLCLEIFVTVACLVALLGELWELISIYRETRSVSGYFASMWNWIDLLSIGLNWSTVCMWWIFVLTQANSFNILLRYDVYEDLEAPAGMLRLAGNQTEGTLGDGMNEVQTAFAELQRIIDSLILYYAINGINVILLISRCLKLMDFQPRLGVVTRSITLAGGDLVHFIIIAGFVFLGYAMMAHLIFGNNIDYFASFSSSIDTCFDILLGDISANAELRELPGLQGIAGTLFFWTYMMLVFLVLLNFLLAIIVDAFSEIKENTTEQVGIGTEIGELLSEKWRSVQACFGRKQHISDARLEQLLKVWGNEEEEEDQEEDEKCVTILGTKMNQSDLAAVLKDTLANVDTTVMDSMDPGKDGKKHFGLGFARIDSMPTEEELDVLSAHIIERFGTTEGEEEEDEEDDGELDLDEQELLAEREAEAGGRVHSEAELVAQREALANALDRLSDIQRRLSEGQQRLIDGQTHVQRQHEQLYDILLRPAVQ